LKRPKYKSTVAIVAIAAGVMAVFCLFRSVPAEAAYPIERAKRGFCEKVTCRIRGALNSAETAAENVRLRREVASLVMARSDADSYAKEMLRLRRLLGYSEKLPGRWIAAPVFSEGGGAAAFRKTIRVGKGALDGIAPGAIAAVPDGLVGKVISVTAHTSEVLLITDPALKVACTIENARGAKGILCGGTDDLLLMKYFTVGATIPPRSRVLTSGLGGIFPAGMQVGTLIDVRLDAGDNAREADIQPTVDFSALEDIFLKVEDSKAG